MGEEQERIGTAAMSGMERRDTEVQRGQLRDVTHLCDQGQHFLYVRGLRGSPEKVVGDADVEFWLTLG